MDNTITALDKIISERKDASPDTSYVAQLHHEGLNKILGKISEEATEVVLAAKEGTAGGEPENVVKEVADLWFHSLVLLNHLGLGAHDVLEELQKRTGVSGHVEKANRAAD